MKASDHFHVECDPVKHPTSPIVIYHPSHEFTTIDLAQAKRFYDALGWAIEEAENALPDAPTKKSAARGDVLTDKELEIEFRNLAPNELAAIGAGEIVNAIRHVRNRSGRSLAQSKQIVDSFRNLMRGKKS